MPDFLLPETVKVRPARADARTQRSARVGQAMLTYEAGDVSDAILELEDEATALVGSAEIHAALAALMYTERPTLAFRAEEVRLASAARKGQDRV